MTTRITKRLICISGFTQNLGKPNGIEKLWMEMRDMENPSVRTSYKPWHSRWGNFAEHILRTSPNDPRMLDIRIFAYSWGCGHGFTALSKQLLKRGIKVSAAVLCDPVYHKWSAPWRAMISPFVTPTIKVPRNVKEVWWLYQRQGKPMGHDVVACNPGTVVHSGIKMDVSHSYADDNPRFHELSLEVAKDERPTSRTDA